MRRNLTNMVLGRLLLPQHDWADRRVGGEQGETVGSAKIWKFTY